MHTLKTFISDDIKLQIWGFRILRIGLALVFIWFGSQQLMNPSGWTGMVPEWIGTIIDLKVFIIMNGIFDLAGGILLLVGWWTRAVAFLLALHLFSIALNFGLQNNGVRDFGLGMASLALSFLSPWKNPKV
jgi:uncharacterized membrane protein YphA (DoxX/SURF4 family)